MQFHISYKRETGKEIPESSRLEFLEKFSANSFALSDAEDKTSGPYRRYSRFPFFENTVDNSPKVPRANFQGSNGFFCFIGMCKFGSFKNPFEKISSFILRFILLVQTKKVISMNASTSSQV